MFIELQEDVYENESIYPIRHIKGKTRFNSETIISYVRKEFKIESSGKPLTQVKLTDGNKIYVVETPEQIDELLGRLVKPTEKPNYEDGDFIMFPNIGGGQNLYAIISGSGKLDEITLLNKFYLHSDVDGRGRYGEARFMNNLEKKRLIERLNMQGKTWDEKHKKVVDFKDSNKK